jgi:hypothetical protein
VGERADCGVSSIMLRKRRAERRNCQGKRQQYELLVLVQKKPTVVSMHASNVGVQMLADG